MYFPRLFLEKVAAGMTESNDRTYIPGSLEMYGDNDYSEIPGQTEGGHFQSARQKNLKRRIDSIRAMFARPDEIAPAIRGDFSHEEALKSKIASSVGRIVI